MYGNFVYGSTELGGLFESEQLISGAVATAQAVQSSAVTGKEMFAGQEVSAQPGQSDLAFGKEIFGAQQVSAQSGQVSSSQALEIFKGGEVSGQDAQSISSQAKETFKGGAQSAQAGQQTIASEVLLIAGDVSTDQVKQNDLALGQNKPPIRTEVGGGYVRYAEEEYPGPLRITGRVVSRNYWQFPSARGKQAFRGDLTSEQLKQNVVSRGAVDFGKIEEEELMMLFLMAA